MTPSCQFNRNRCQYDNTGHVLLSRTHIIIIGAAFRARGLRPRAAHTGVAACWKRSSSTTTIVSVFFNTFSCSSLNGRKHPRSLWTHWSFHLHELSWRRPERATHEKRSLPTASLLAPPSSSACLLVVNKPLFESLPPPNVPVADKNCPVNSIEGFWWNAYSQCETTKLSTSERQCFLLHIWTKIRLETRMCLIQTFLIEQNAGKCHGVNFY